MQEFSQYITFNVEHDFPLSTPYYLLEAFKRKVFNYN